MRGVLATILTVTALVLASGVLSAEQSAEPAEEAVTMAEEYGLAKSQIASFDAALSGRLVRFGRVAMGRGRFLEAKRFFWKALLVDPTSVLAWRFYDQAVIFGLADKVEKSPDLVGLPGLLDEPAPVRAVEPEIEEGC